MRKLKGDGYKESISYEFFLKVAEDPNEKVATVSRKGFEHYEGGAMGFGWVYYYFKNKEEQKLYKRYLKEHPEFKNRSEV